MGLRSKMEPQPYNLRSSSTTTTTASSRSFFGRNLIKKDSNRTDEQNDQPKGPLGLTTLYAPDQGVVDIIFVHGLNGGSFSTWTKGGASLFWPKEWLKNDDAFSDVRIHTFGYSSGISRESILNIQDFATGLLAGIQDAPSIPQEETVCTFCKSHLYHF
jgi:hypothetical protein